MYIPYVANGRWEITHYIRMIMREKIHTLKKIASAGKDVGSSSNSLKLFSKRNLYIHYNNTIFLQRQQSASSYSLYHLKDDSQLIKWLDMFVRVCMCF